MNAARVPGKYAETQEPYFAIPTGKAISEGRPRGLRGAFGALGVKEQLNRTGYAGVG